jgi:hypothetical protein
MDQDHGDSEPLDCRYYLSYRGVEPPSIMVGPLAEEALANRNTFIRAYFDRAGVLHGFDKIVYGEVELSHRYQYHPNGRIRRAEIAMPDEDPGTVDFDDTGRRLPQGAALQGRQE